MNPIEEQVVLVTGATSGHGQQLARDLARAGATVLLHGRDASRTAAAVAEIRSQTGNQRVVTYLADLSSLSQVRRLADEVLARHPRLEALVNNAGIGRGKRGENRRALSEDGYELRFAVNYLAPYLLTRLLVPRLVHSAPSRIVNVSSAGQSPIDFDDVMLERGYDGFQAYCQSKLAQVMFTFDLAAELRGTGVTVNCLHPATYMPTRMVLETGTTPTSSLEEGVRATLRLVVDPSLDEVTGKYFDGLREARADPQAYDAEARSRLRDLSEQLLGYQLSAISYQLRATSE
jgi:NAD(P)-dependent dehydrogenase (short-subunit alcohol dehydrogenase family)